MKNINSSRWVAHKRRVAAIHESAHAIAALACGSYVFEVSIEPSVGPSGPRLGHCEWATMDDEDEAKIALAGGIAERLWWPRRNGHYIAMGCSTDYAYVAEIAKRMFENEIELERFWRTQTRRARATLRNNRDIVDSVAKTLESQGTIGVEFFEKIYSSVKKH